MKWLYCCIFAYRGIQWKSLVIVYASPNCLSTLSASSPACSAPYDYGRDVVVGYSVGDLRSDPLMLPCPPSCILLYGERLHPWRGHRHSGAYGGADMGRPEVSNR